MLKTSFSWYTFFITVHNIVFLLNKLLILDIAHDLLCISQDKAMHYCLVLAWYNSLRMFTCSKRKGSVHKLRPPQRALSPFDFLQSRRGQCLLSKHALQYFCMVSVPFLWLVANFTGCLRGVCAPRVWPRPVNLSAAPHVSHRCLSISPPSHSSTSKLCSLQCYKAFFFH